MEDMYGQPQDYFPVDDLLDLSNDEIFSNSSSTSSADSHHHHHHHHHNHHQHYHAPPPPPTTQPHFFNPPTIDFTNALCLPNEDVAELEWLSRFVDDSFTDFPAPPPEMHHLPNHKSFSNRPYNNNNNNNNKPSSSRRSSSSDHHQEPHIIRRCTHCASEKTPQWRTGPLGPKTLCNACGVRYKSGRLVPEYRPAASPTFVLTQHSNSHRKVMELRRQKEVVSQQLPEEQQQQFYLHPNGFRVC